MIVSDDLFLLVFGVGHTYFRECVYFWCTVSQGFPAYF